MNYEFKPQALTLFGRWYRKSNDGCRIIRLSLYVPLLYRYGSFDFAITRKAKHWRYSLFFVVTKFWKLLNCHLFIGSFNTVKFLKAFQIIYCILFGYLGTT